jgi:trigger factor
MQVSVESLSAIERRITVTVPVEKITSAYEQRIAKFAKSAKIDGFRPGKAPMAVITQRYGDAAQQEALTDVIQSSLFEVISKEKFNLVGMPHVEPKEMAPNQPLEYVATFEVVPEVGTVNFELASLDKLVAVITEKDVDEVLEHLQSQYSTWEKVTRAAEEKDQVTIDFRGSIDGVVFPGGEAHDYPIVIGSKKMIPGFEEGVNGLTPDEETTIKVTFPEDYHAKELAGKEAAFAIKVISISAPVLPKLDKSFVQKLGIKSGEAADLRAEVQKNLSRELERVMTQKLKTSVFDQLLEQNPLEIPKAMIEREAKRVHDEAHKHHGEHSHSDDEMAVYNDVAKRNSALGLLLAELISQRKIVASKSAVLAQITEMAAPYQNPEEVIKYYQQDKKSYAEVEMRVLEDLVIQNLLENVTIVEKTLIYQELMNS